MSDTTADGPATRARPRRATSGRNMRVSRPKAASKIGLALAGGGPLGGIYEVGALLALADSLDGLDFNRLDVYVGVSSGGFVAAALANDISPAQMYRLFIDDGADAALKPELFLRPAFGEFARCLGTLPGLAGRATLQYLRDPFRRGVIESVATLAQAIPTGVFDNRAIDTFLARLFGAPGRTNDFRRLSRRLYLVATNLDSGASETFGPDSHANVPISRAIQASSALPGLFPPVDIDGQHYVDGALNKTLHASIALDAGADLLLCINPLVPFDAAAARRRGRVKVEQLNRSGLPLVLGQTFRAILHSRLQAGMEKYRQQYPHADILLFQPDREDADMFFANIFSYWQRKRLCALAFVKTRQNLLARTDALAPVLRRHGISIRHDRLEQDRDIATALTDARPLRPDAARSSVKQAKRDLAHALDQLERVVAVAR